jgi:prolyl oligopeptidase
VLIGRVITERPDLFASAGIQAGVLNPLRLLAGTNGANQIPEFGSPEDEAGFKNLLAMDPYQHIRDGVPYPAVLLMAGLNDNRVSPWHTGKVAARLQIASSSGKPVLVRIDEDAGHGFGSTRDQEAARWADFYAFVLWQSGDPGFQPARQIQSDRE